MTQDLLRIKARVERALNTNFETPRTVGLANAMLDLLDYLESQAATPETTTERHGPNPNWPWPQTEMATGADTPASQETAATPDVQECEHPQKDRWNMTSAGGGLHQWCGKCGGVKFASPGDKWKMPSTPQKGA